MEGLVMSAPINFWRGKRVLLTGHTGFKGAWLALMLHRLGAHITGISLPPTSVPNLFGIARIDDVSDSHLCDIRDASAINGLIDKSQPEIVFHLAAQALVRASYKDPLTTFGTNVQGTANVLDAVRHLSCVRVVVVVTTDKVYRSHEQHYPCRETDALGGHDPYSASKAAAEIVIASYRDSYLAVKKIAVASARAGNVIGGGDWSEDRLIPDAVRAWNSRFRATLLTITEQWNLTELRMTARARIFGLLPAKMSTGKHSLCAAGSKRKTVPWFGRPTANKRGRRR